MMMDVDVVVIGTGLTESIAAAALSKAGFKVAHIDANPYYGGDDASLTADELVEWADIRATPPEPEGPASASSYLSAQRAKFKSISRSGSALSQSRQYSLSLAPALIPSIGPLIDALIASGVSRYGGGFKLLEKVAVYTGSGSVSAVPGSKEDVFKNKELTLLEKRRLMRFLMFAAGEFECKQELQGKEDAPFVAFLQQTFSLDDRTAHSIAYALAFCRSSTDSTLPALQRIRRYLRSTGRYGPSPFLVGHYGGLGEIAQGFCRTAAVNGATYILGRQVVSAKPQIVQTDTSAAGGKPRRYTLELEDLPEQLACDVIITAPDYLTSKLQPHSAEKSSGARDQIHAVAHCVAIIDKPIVFPTSDHAQDESSEDAPDEETIVNEEQPRPPNPELDTAILVFPPSSLPDGSFETAVNVLVTGEGSMSAPRGKWVLYLSMPINDSTTQTPEELLRPYLDATLSLAGSGLGDVPSRPLSTLFYIKHPSSTDVVPSTIPVQNTPVSVSITPSEASLLPELADSATMDAEKLFWQAVEALKTLGRKPRRQEDGDEGSEREIEVEVDAFWPPLDVVDDPPEEW